MAVRRGELAPPEHGEHGANRACNSLVAIQEICQHVAMSAMYTNIHAKWKNLDKINEIQKL